uniref:Potassium/proton antiporter CemA n=1 Tax=Neodangemannia microcystis TaxID=173495 RepID=A0A1W6EHC2_9CHLO|nr:chloroplast enveloppe membrane protein [Neodangemannia microcystis]ARK14735.1 chloroplast enveloppe membrane protein [Neodangemannia microcystis]
MNLFKLKKNSNRKKSNVTKAIEKIGLIPRSIIRTFGRFQQQLFPEAIDLFLQEFRISRYQVLVSVQCLFVLIIIPFCINVFTKTFLLTPLTEYVWNKYKTDIFLNTYQQEQAIQEIRNFESTIYFDLLIENKTVDSTFKDKSYLTTASKNEKRLFQNSIVPTTVFDLEGTRCNGSNAEVLCTESTSVIHNYNSFQPNLNVATENALDQGSQAETLKYSIPMLMQAKLTEIAFESNKQSISALTNLLADLLTLARLQFIFIKFQSQIIILKSFLIETFYSLNDTTKSFLLIFSTDLLVGFHSPRGWELFLEFVITHFGLPHNENVIFLFVATFPVLVDSVIKYWIFRYLNKISPSTVATYHAMIE